MPSCVFILIMKECLQQGRLGKKEFTGFCYTENVSSEMFLEHLKNCLFKSELIFKKGAGGLISLSIWSGSDSTCKHRGFGSILLQLKKDHTNTVFKSDVTFLSTCYMKYIILTHRWNNSYYKREAS